MTPDNSPTYGRPSFEEPTTDHFLYAGWCVDPPTRLPIVGRSDQRERMIERCRAYTVATERHEGVVSATVYETEMIPPLPGIPRYDLLTLIRARTPGRLTQAETDLQDLDPDFVMPAQNTRRIGDTDRTGSATFLFNHFTAEEPTVALEGFDQVAGWFPDKLGVDNTTLLQPVDQAASPYVFVTTCACPTAPADSSSPCSPGPASTPMSAGSCASTA